MTFTEDWFSDASCEVLADLYGVVENLTGAVIEVGCWEGKSTCALANAAYPHKVRAVDTWQGSPGEVSAKLAQGRDVFGQFLENVQTLTKGNVVVNRQGWRDFFAKWEDPVRFIHIDATHTYEEVRDNIEAVLPFIEPGGIICGDDVHHPPVQRAVRDTLGPDVLTEETLWWWRRPHVTFDLQAEYRNVCVTPSDIYLHLPRLVDLVLARGAKHVVELGTRSGVSTVAFLYALEKTGGRLTSVDIDPGPDLGEQPAWTFIRGDDLDPDVVTSLDEADIVFIDTSHLYDHTCAELRVYRHLVKPGGVIVCHDTQLPHPMGAPPRPLFPVRKAIEEFVAEEGFEWHEHTDCFGLGIIEVI